MRRTILLLAGVLLSPVALGSDSPKEYDDKMVTVGTERAWRLTHNFQQLHVGMSEEEVTGILGRPPDIRDHPFAGYRSWEWREQNCVVVIDFRFRGTEMKVTSGTITPTDGSHLPLK